MEKRFHMLRPEQIIEQRDKCPVAYIPLGTLEWHGLHNPIGADGLQAEELALRCANQGGVVFPNPISLHLLNILWPTHLFPVTSCLEY